ncbi:MAG: hypothetical protein J6L79_08070 [Muribaculaceae bacterium]|nr:hypothetical protein [Muribaculaceae bacterium]
MKLNKILAIALAALTMTACSDDDDSGYNTAADVTVNMADPTMNATEDYTGIMYNVPIEVTGVANGPIKVTVEMQGVGSTPAEADKHYIVTTDYVIIPEGETIGYIEFHPTGDDEINENRVFDIKIVKAEGAKIGTQTTTTITLKDDDHLIPQAYSATIGNWMVDCSDGQYQVEITGYPEGDPKYGKEVNVVGIGGDPDYPNLTAVAQISVDPDTEQIKLTFNYGQVIGTVMTSRFGEQKLQFIGFDGTYIYPTGSQDAVSNPSRTQFAFSEGFAGCYNAGGWYGWFMQLDVSMTKIAN